MPLRYLFVDMNSYFASVEQQDDPKLRGRPIGVVPVMARSTCCIAASREAKLVGIKTGTPVWEAEKICRDFVPVLARPERYVRIHHRIVDAVGRCVPVGRVMSIDEMSCPLVGEEREPDRALAIGRRIKAELRADVGEVLTCSIGLGPSVMLAKVAGDLQKPDGLTAFRDDDLPDALHRLKLTDFPGIGPRMERRLQLHGLVTAAQLCRASARTLSEVWGSRIHGERWFRLLRGEDVPDKRTVRRTVGHSHVLPPSLRTDAGSHGVIVRLIHKAAARLRGMDYWCGALSVGLRYADGSRWDAGCRVARCQDTPSLLRAFGQLWHHRPPGREPKKVGMVLSDLVPARSATPSLFPDDQKATELSHTVDDVNREFGRSTVYFGTMHGMEDTAPTRIAFTRIPEFDRAIS